MRLTPGLGVHLRGLADELLVNDFPGATMQRHEREMLATAVSAENDCFFCMDSHGAFAGALLEREDAVHLEPVIDVIETGSSDGVSPKMAALLQIARTVRQAPLRLTRADVERPTRPGPARATCTGRVIASAFSMYNRLVDGFRARTAPSTEAYRARAAESPTTGTARRPQRARARRRPPDSGSAHPRPTRISSSSASSSPAGSQARPSGRPSSRRRSPSGAWVCGSTAMGPCPVASPRPRIARWTRSRGGADAELRPRQLHRRDRGIGPGRIQPVGRCGKAAEVERPAGGPRIGLEAMFEA